MTPQRGRRQSPQLDTHMLGYGDTVRVLLPPHVSPRSGAEGTVRRVQLVGGDLLITVEFGDGVREGFYENELRRTATAPKRPTPASE